MKRAIADKSSSPIDIGVPSSSNWKPTTALRRRTQRVATIAPRWAAVKPWIQCQEHYFDTIKQPRHTIRTRPLRGKPPTVKISHISTIMYPRRNSCISLQSTVSVNAFHLRDHNVYLRPTAAFFLSDLHIKRRATSMAMPQRSIEPDMVSSALENAICPQPADAPRFARFRPLLSGIPVN